MKQPHRTLGGGRLKAHSPKRLRYFLAAAILTLSSLFALVPQNALATGSLKVSCYDYMQGDSQYADKMVIILDSTDPTMFEGQKKYVWDSPTVTCIEYLPTVTEGGSFGSYSVKNPTVNVTSMAEGRQDFNDLSRALSSNSSFRLDEDTTDGTTPDADRTYYARCRDNNNVLTLFLENTKGSTGTDVVDGRTGILYYINSPLSCSEIAPNTPYQGLPNNTGKEVSLDHIFAYRAWVTAFVGDPDKPGTALEEDDSDSVDPPASTCELGKFGWALCPLIEGMDAMLGGIYTEVVEPFLQIDIQFYEANDSNGTYVAWGTFRNIANIFFVIFFLIVIFSQVTSVGISNYGIKKMLPEIILAALLINLSYFICQAMVDISNIVGVSISDLLDTITREITKVNPAPDGTGGFIHNIITILAIGGTAAAAITIATVLTGGISAVLAGIILLLLSGLIGALILFLLLIVRQVGVVLLIVLAPLAFAARILPNTQGLFKNWWKTFTTLLVVYPACGLVIGGGKLAGAIIASTSEGKPLVAIAAGIAMIAPYFAVISIIKGSLNGLGKLGGAITGKLNGAGAGLNKLSRTGVGAAGNKIGQLTGYSAGRQARLATAKAKIEAKDAERMAEGKGHFGTLQRAQITAAQAKSDAELANLGQYHGDNEKFQKISAARAAELGVDPNTGLKTREPENAVERELQAAAKTARNKADARAAEEAAAGFAGRKYGEVYDEFYKDGKIKDGSDQISTEQAIKYMEDNGEWEKSAALQDAYMKKWGGDARGRGRLGQILNSPKAKEESFARSAYGKAMFEKGYTGSFADFMGDKENGIGKVIKDGKYKKTYGTMHGEALKELAQYDKDGSLRRQIAAQMNLQTVGQLDNNMDAFLTNYGADGKPDGTKLDATELFKHVAQDYVDAGNNAATFGYSNGLKNTIGIPAAQAAAAGERPHIILPP
ncbi:MAG: hypothetical protein LBM12_00705 [Candidatus Nomurabacteria bacterium]|jgi:hypothetical protein|nr:hypothetical protein [Candidatus Nomurabacteria bacterium]